MKKQWEPYYSPLFAQALRDLADFDTKHPGKSDIPLVGSRRVEEKTESEEQGGRGVREREERGCGRERNREGGMGRKGNWEGEMRREGWMYRWEERRKKKGGRRSLLPGKTLDIHKIERMLAHIFVYSWAPLSWCHPP